MHSLLFPDDFYSLLGYRIRSSIKSFLRHGYLFVIFLQLSCFHPHFYSYFFCIFLSASDPEERLSIALEILTKEREVAKLQRDIAKQVEEKMAKSQREYFLREQLKSIKKVNICSMYYLLFQSISSYRFLYLSRSVISVRSL